MHQCVQSSLSPPCYSVASCAIEMEEVSFLSYSMGQRCDVMPSPWKDYILFMRFWMQTHGDPFKNLFTMPNSVNIRDVHLHTEADVIRILMHSQWYDTLKIHIKQLPMQCDPIRFIPITMQCDLIWFKTTQCNPMQ